MFVSALWHYIFGYVIIKAEGLSLEKFINLCLQKGIHLWDVRRQSYTVLKARISIRGLRQLIPVVRVTHCRIEILAKRGLPFLIARLKHRYMFIVGFVLFFFIIYALSSFIWIVEISGDARVPGEFILQELSKSGLKPGVQRKDLSLRAIESDMLMKLPELSWIGIDIQGTKAVVRVVEAVMPPPRVDMNTPCDVIAAKDGVISKLIVLQGQAVVKPGQTVKKGQLLITGVIKKEGVDTRYVHAMGEVWAHRWYEGHAQLPIVSVQKKRTGRVTTRKYMLIGNKKINIYNPPITYDSYDKIDVVELSLDKVPVKIVTEQYYETVEQTTTADIESLRQQLQQLAADDAAKHMDQGAGQITDKKFTFSIDENNIMHADALLEVLERIDQEKVIEMPIEEEHNSGDTTQR